MGSDAELRVKSYTDQTRNALRDLNAVLTNGFLGAFKNFLKYVT